MDHGVHINTPEQKRQNTRIYATIIYDLYDVSDILLFGFYCQVCNHSH